MFAAGVQPALADVAATPDDVNYGYGEVKTCTTPYHPGIAGVGGAWGAYVDGCTVKVRCMFKEGCTVGGRGTIHDEVFAGSRVTLNSRLRVLDTSGTKTVQRFDNSCDGKDHCSAGNLDFGLTDQALASVQCNGVSSTRGRQRSGHLFDPRRSRLRRLRRTAAARHDTAGLP